MRIVKSEIQPCSKLIIKIETCEIEGVGRGTITGLFDSKALNSPPPCTTLYRASVAHISGKYTYGYLEAPTLDILKELVTSYLKTWGVDLLPYQWEIKKD